MKKKSKRALPKRSWIIVGGENRVWENGKTLIFDTSFTHETWNDGETDRYVLLLRFWHPGLTRKEVNPQQAYHVFNTTLHSSRLVLFL